MELSVKEAATLLHRSPRAVRAQLARGDLQGVKRDGRWRIDRRRLPLTEKQRRTLQAKASRIRKAVDDALPSRAATRAGQRSRSLADMAAFRHGAELLKDIRAAEPESFPAPARERAGDLLEQALIAIAEAALHFERDLKLAALERGRGLVARTVGVLLIEAGIPPRDPAAGWVDRLENAVLPAVAGFARWIAQLPRSGS